MLNKTLLSFFCAVSIIGATTQTVFAETTLPCSFYGRNLTIGMSGDDVLALQKFLNTDKRVEVSEFGVGSRGNETNYFGPMTAAAVVRFQELHVSEVLTPVGLTQGSGYVGIYTRLFMAKQCLTQKIAELTASSSPVPTPTSVSQAIETPAEPVVVIPSVVASSTETVSLLPGGSATPLESIGLLSPSLFRTDILHIKYPSSYTVKRGETFTLYAGGYTENNTVHIGNTAISGLKPDLVGNLQVKVPTDIAYGYHEMWLSNEKGETPKQFLDITLPDAITPVITSLSPNEGYFGTTISISGTGFVTNNNHLRTSYGVISGINSADGKTLQFQIFPPIPGLGIGEDRPEFDINEPVYISVLNENGMSKAVKFIFKI